MSFSSKHIRPFAKMVSAVAACHALIGAGGCAQQDQLGATAAVPRAIAASPGNVDILVMVDNSSSMTSMQEKMVAQIPSFIASLEALPLGLPNIHLAVVSSDLGAPGDSTAGINCTPVGDNGVFQSAPRSAGLFSMCTNTTLTAGATFISNVDGVANYSGKLADVFSCIALLGSSGCGFEHQLASVARALGADGNPPPAQNQGFLRADAELAIILLTNEDDCSAPATTKLYSLNGGTQDLSNPLGPIANYRCNQFGHLCNDPSSATPGALESPPLVRPSDATGNPPALVMTNCESNDSSTGLLTPLSQLIDGIKALKAEPDYDIVVGAIMSPTTPYIVEWLPSSGQPANEIWPAVEHSCGPTSDGSFGDPGVRIAQWVQAFGDNGVTASICDGSYAPAFQLIASKIGAHLKGAVSGAGGQSGLDSGAGATGQGGAGAIGAGFGGAGMGGGGTTDGSDAGGGLAGGGGSGGGGGGTFGGAIGGYGGTSTGGGLVSGAGGPAGASPYGGGEKAGTFLAKSGGCGCEMGRSPASARSLTLFAALLFARRTRRRASARRP
jgi:hypothetical protein